MQLTEQQRAELERRGWKVADHQDQFWQYIELTRGQTALRLDKLGIDIPRNADEPSLRDVAEIAAVLDITPPGYRLVPEEVAEKAVQAIDDMMLLANEAGLAPQPGALERIMSAREALSRLQQNWEQPAETRITVTIDVQTRQGYHDRRVIEVEPGIGWPERMAPEVLKAALEMEEQFLRRGLQQNGGEGR